MTSIEAKCQSKWHLADAAPLGEILGGAMKHEKPGVITQLQ